MKKVIVSCLAVLLAGCFDDTSDLRAYTEQVRQSAVPLPEKMPSIPEFKHVDYLAMTSRSPFMAPRPEIAQESTTVSVQNCLAPDNNRRREPLERFPTDNITMRGTLGLQGSLWALVEVNDGSIHRVREGNYLGLYHGKISRVTEHQLNLIELIPDGTGCWKERETVLAMIEAGKE